jgi:hypothetical protein
MRRFLPKVETVLIATMMAVALYLGSYYFIVAAWAKPQGPEAFSFVCTPVGKMVDEDKLAIFYWPAHRFDRATNPLAREWLPGTFSINADECSDCPTLPTDETE